MPADLTFTLNTRLPLDFVETNYIDPVSDFLEEGELGSVTGQGQLWSRDFAEPQMADFSVTLERRDEAVITEIVEILEQAGAPLGCSWHDDATPEEDRPFGTLDAVLLKVRDLAAEDHGLFEERLHDLIDRFHKAHADKAGFQGVSLNPQLVVVAFHGFDHNDMKAWLRELIDAVGLPGTCALETQVSEAA